MLNTKLKRSIAFGASIAAIFAGGYMLGGDNSSENESEQCVSYWVDRAIDEGVNMTSPSFKDFITDACYTNLPEGDNY